MPHMTTVTGVAGEFGVLGTWTATTPSSGAAWTIDQTTGAVTGAKAPIIQQTAVGAFSSQHVLLKLLVEWDYTINEAGYNAVLIGAQVREYFT